MPNYYIVRSCLGFNDHPVGLVIESESTLSIGNVVSYIYDETPYCGQIINTAEFPSNTTVISAFTFCCECFTSVDGTDSNSFQFEKCGTFGEKIYVDITTFCESTVLVPQLGNIYQLINSITGEIICATFNSLANDIGVTSWSYYEGPEVSCETCQNKILDYPRSANTQSLVCEVCCPCESGSTFTVLPPSPVWTDGRGTAVTQLNMIVLGGENGLNN